MFNAQLPDMSQVLLTANCAEYAKCTVTGYVTGAPYCQLCRICLMHSYRICQRCSLLPTVQSMLNAQLPDMLKVLLTAICAKVAEHSASQKLHSPVKFEITWNFSAKILAYVSMPTMAYRFSAKNIATEIARIRQTVSFRQVSNVRPEKMYEYLIIDITLPEFCVNLLSQCVARGRLLILGTDDYRRFVA